MGDDEQQSARVLAAESNQSQAAFAENGPTGGAQSPRASSSGASSNAYNSQWHHLAVCVWRR